MWPRGPGRIASRIGDPALGAVEEYDRLGAEDFFSARGFVPPKNYELVVGGSRYPSKTILGAAYEVATGQRLGSDDFEGGKGDTVRVLERLGFEVKAIQREGTLTRGFVMPRVGRLSRACRSPRVARQSRWERVGQGTQASSLALIAGSSARREPRSTRRYVQAQPAVCCTGASAPELPRR